MADLTSERDRRVRELLARKDSGKNPNEIGVLSQGQAEIQNIQSELGNDIALQRVQDQARLQETGVMSQAAEGMLAMDSGGQGQVLSRQVGGMNQSTQAIMQRYGVKPENSRKATSMSSRSVSGAGTTNIRTENITNNHTEIKITQPQIPVSQPQVAISAPRIQTDNTAKFKTWLSGMFAKQQNEAEIQKKEYRKKEWNLARTTTRLMKRIEGAASNMTSRLDPQRMTSTLGGQLKWLLLLFGATMIAKVWKPTMKFIANLEGGFRSVFGLPINADLARGGAQGISIVDQMKKFIGIKDSRTTLIGGIGDVFMQGINKMIDKLKFWFEDRAGAIRDVEFPEISTPKINIPGFGSLMEGISDTLKGVGQYIGDLLTVAMGGSKGKVRSAANHIRSKAVESFTDTRGQQRTYGDDGLLNGGGRSYMRESDFGVGGVLKGNAGSTQAMSRTLGALMNDNSSTSHSAEIASGVQQLFDVAKRNGQVVIDPAFLSQLGFTQNDINQLKAQKGLVPVQYKIIQVHPSKAQYEEEGMATHFHQTGAGLTGAGVGAWAGAKMGAAGGSFFGPIGTAVGGVGGALIGGIGGYYVGSSTGAGIDAYINEDGRKNGLVSKLVPINSSEVSDDGSPAIKKTMFALTKQGADAVAEKFMSGAKDQSIDLANQEFYDRIRRIEERRKRANGVRGPLKQGISTNELQSAQAQYKACQAEYYDRFKSNNPNSWNMQHYGAYNTFTDNMGDAFNSAREWTADQLRSISGSVYSAGGGKGRHARVDKTEQRRRVNYALKAFIDHGLTKEQAAGIVGNLIQEGLFLKNLGTEYMDGRPGSSTYGPSAGIAGFHDENRAIGKGELGKLKKFAAERGLNWGDFETQIQYLVEGGGASQSAIEKIRRIQGDSASVAAESAFQWGYNYERFATYRDRNGADHTNRRNNAIKILKEDHDLSDVAVTNYASSGPLINVQGVGGKTDITESGEFRIAWLGDSQTVTSGSGFPKGVASGLGVPMMYYGMSSSNALHYLGKATLNNRPATNIKELSGRKCSEALEYVISKRPDYCILALGHNGTRGLQDLVRVLNGAGIKVVIIKMWAIDGRAHGMATYTPAQSSALYDGISTDAWVDLTWVDVDKTPDGVHANANGCKKAAEETVYQLKNGTRSTWSDVSGDGENGIFGDITGALAEGLGVVADFMDPNNKEVFSPFNKQKFTNEQIESIRKYNDFTSKQFDINLSSFLEKGAKIDKSGVYLESGNYKLYVDPTRNGALMGFDRYSFEFVMAKDGHAVSQEEADRAKQAASIEINSLASNYPEKGGTNDYMTEGSKILYFRLGSFSDLNFTAPAIADFEAHAHGQISYFISPSKDRARVSIIGISGAPYASAPSKVKSSHIIVTDYENGSDDVIESFYGPEIFHKGSEWTSWGTLKSDNKKTYDWQPICLRFRVFLTPKAEDKKNELMNLLSLGELNENENGEIVDEKGNALTKEQLEKAANFGILSSETKTYGFGEGQELYTEYKIKDNVNAAQKISSSLVKGGNKLDIEKYLSEIGVKDDEKIKEFYDKNRHLFETVGNKIIGPSGVVIGSVDSSGNISFYSKEQIEENNTLTSIRDNQNEATYLKSSMIGLKDYGMFDINAELDFMRIAENKKNSLNSADFQNIKSNREKYKITKSVTVADEFKFSRSNRKVPFSYNLEYNEDGSVKRAYISDNQMSSLLSGLYGEDKKRYFTNVKIDVSDKDAENPAYELKKRIKNKVLDIASRIEGVDQFLNGDIEDPSQHYNGSEQSYIDQLMKEASSHGGIKEIHEGAAGYVGITYNDNTSKSFGVGSSEWSKDADKRKKMLDQLKAIQDEHEKNKQLYAEIQTFENTGLYDQYLGFAQKFNTGELEGATVEGDNVKINGRVVAKIKKEKKDDGTEKEIAITDTSDLLTLAKKNLVDDVNASEGVKASMYKRVFGAILGNDGRLFVYNGKKERVEIDLSKDFSTDLKKVAKKVEVFDGESWINVKAVGGHRDMTKDSEGNWTKHDIIWGWGDDQTDVYNSVINGAQASSGINEKEDVGAELLRQMNETLADQLNLANASLSQAERAILMEREAAITRAKQLKSQQEIAANTRKIADEDWTGYGDALKQAAQDFKTSMASAIGVASKRILDTKLDSYKTDNIAQNIKKITTAQGDFYMDLNKATRKNVNGRSFYEGYLEDGTKAELTTGGHQLTVYDSSGSPTIYNSNMVNYYSDDGTPTTPDGSARPGSK